MSENTEMLKEPIRKYLETQIQRDDALKTKYNPDSLEGCVNYINKQAREMLKNSNGFVEDAVVYKWARDYFIEDIAAKKAEESAKREQEKKEQEMKTEKKKSPVKDGEPTKVKDSALEIKPSITTKKTEKKQPEQSWLFDFGD